MDRQHDRPGEGLLLRFAFVGGDRGVHDDLGFDGPGLGAFRAAGALGVLGLLFGGFTLTLGKADRSALAHRCSLFKEAYVGIGAARGRASHGGRQSPQVPRDRMAGELSGLFSKKLQNYPDQELNHPCTDGMRAARPARAAPNATALHAQSVQLVRPARPGPI